MLVIQRTAERLEAIRDGQERHLQGHVIAGHLIESGLGNGHSRGLALDQHPGGHFGGVNQNIASAGEGVDDEFLFNPDMNGTVSELVNEVEEQKLPHMLFRLKHQPFSANGVEDLPSPLLGPGLQVFLHVQQGEFDEVLHGKGLRNLLMCDFIGKNDLLGLVADLQQVDPFGHPGR